MSTMSMIGAADALVGPSGSVDLGHLIFTRGASNIRIGVDRSMNELYRARFDGKAPHISAEEGTVTVAYRMALRPPRGEIVLSGLVPWSIRARMGMSHVTAELEDLDLRDLEISGGASQIEMRLPRPKGSVRVRIGGGASNVELVRPGGVPVHVHIGSGASKLAVDDFRLGSAGGKTEWRSPEYDRVADRYDVEIGAGASKVTIRT